MLWNITLDICTHCLQQMYRISVGSKSSAYAQGACILSCSVLQFWNDIQILYHKSHKKIANAQKNCSWLIYEVLRTALFCVISQRVAVISYQYSLRNNPEGCSIFATEAWKHAQEVPICTFLQRFNVIYCKIIKKSQKVGNLLA